MRRARLDPAALAGGAVWAAGTWCAAGAIAPDAAGGRIGVAAPLWGLLALAAIAGAGVAACRPTGRQAAPLWLPAVSTLPWLPMPLPPAALLAVGPAGLVLAAVALAAGLAAPRAIDARRLGRGAAALAVAAVFVASAWWVSPRIPGGDEPHYLVITQSLLRDGDLKIENNHQRRDYAAYVDGELRPDYLRRGRDGAIYSIHAPGASALVLPAFAVGGYPAVVIWLAVLSALALLIAWRAAEQASGSAAAGAFATAGVGLSAPFFFQAFTVYPDGPAAVAVMAVVWIAMVRTGPPGWPQAALCGALLGLLPWLHTRYGAIAAPLGLIAAGRIVWPAVPDAAASKWRQLAALAAPALLSAACWLWMFQAIYGTWDPRAPYGQATDMRLARIPHGLSGLLLDQQFGLLPYAPVYVLACAGLGVLLRHRRRLGVELMLAPVPYAASVAAFHMWWGGHSSPARFLVPVLLPMAIPLAAWWATRSTRAARAGGLLLLGWSLALTAGLVLDDRGALVYDTRDGHALWLLAASRAVNLTYAWPSLFQGGPAQAWAVAGAWAGAAAAGWLLMRRVELGGVSRGPWRTAVLAAGALSVAAGTTLSWAITSGPAEDPGTATLGVLAEGCHDRRIAIRTGPMRAGPAPGALEGLRVADASRRPAPRGTVRWSAADVPPGRYRLAAGSGRRVSGSVDVALGRPDAILSRCRIDERPGGRTACEIVLPAGAAALWITGDAQLSRTADSLWLEVDGPGDPDLCGARAARALVHAAATWFVVDGRAWVEPAGLWTGGGQSVRLVPAGREAIVRVRIRQGAVGGPVRISTGGWQQARELAPGERWDIDVPGRSGRDVAFTVESPAAFRPAEHDPSSSDTRLLGVWVEPR